MKKLMMTAAAVALAGVATASNVFDYKASVKYVDFKKVSGNWVKTVKSTTLKGYLVTPINCACEAACSGRENGFLVLTSSLAKKYDKDYQVKLMPANLLASAWSQKYVTLDGVKSTTLEAQGYLFAGLGKCAQPDPDGTPVYGFGDLNVTAATKYLFGQANIEDEVYEYGELVDMYFIEPFLDAAGFGKAGWSQDADPLCRKGASGWCLKSLSGSVIGGSYSCMANKCFEAFRCQDWDNETANNSEIDYTGFGQFYNVVSGTWSIKENKKIEGTTVKALVTACGQKLQKTFTLATFDFDAAEKYRGAFVEKWFK